VKPSADAISPPGGEDNLLIAACCTALATLVPVALYQTGMLKRLPDPPFGVFNSERITKSKAAHPFGIPDSLLGLASFATTLALILLARRRPDAKRLLGAKLTLDLSAAVFNASRQVISFGELCSWCTATALAAGGMAYSGRRTIQHAWKEAASAMETLARTGLDRTQAGRRLESSERQRASMGVEQRSQTASLIKGRERREVSSPSPQSSR
jgi:uncharacterized membrane protein